MSSLFRYARSFFTSAPVSQEQKQVAKDTVESLISASPVAVFSKSFCPYCTEAKSILSSLGQGPRMKVLELNQMEQGSAIQAYLAERVGASKVTVPQVYIKGQNIGGCSDLKKLQASGKLDELLA
ncbi:glutaredoxin [Rhodotorula diobovata]|uniref:Glutaredoxin n=1 Tax=Rhodotorula diobovata TaxID=5288 RepID=A0A5C5FQR1_9BASI|nr:glutaredoxin [Rhodotorula diobovata]